MQQNLDVAPSKITGCHRRHMQGDIIDGFGSWSWMPRFKGQLKFDHFICIYLIYFMILIPLSVMRLASRSHKQLLERLKS